MSISAYVYAYVYVYEYYACMRTYVYVYEYYDIYFDMYINTRIAEMA
jgi:hypothetical protein